MHWLAAFQVSLIPVIMQLCAAVVSLLRRMLSHSRLEMLCGMSEVCAVGARASVSAAVSRGERRALMSRQLKRAAAFSEVLARTNIFKIFTPDTRVVSRLMQETFFQVGELERASGYCRFFSGFARVPYLKRKNDYAQKF